VESDSLTVCVNVCTLYAGGVGMCLFLVVYNWKQIQFI